MASVLGIADRFSPSKVFFVSSIVAAVSNMIMLVDQSSFPIVLTSRFLVGFFLAGIYPVGMKIAADWSEKGLGVWLGALVGALVLGTAFPQILRASPELIEPKSLILIVTILATVGGALVYLFIKDGPFRKSALRFSFSDISKIYRKQETRSAAFGYFGHMWELYAFWAFVPWSINAFNMASGDHLNIPLWAFMIVSAGFIGCLIGGTLSKMMGSRKVALVALICSAACCVFSPFMHSLPSLAFISVMIFWGLTVVADSPQLSTLVAHSATAEIKGSVITLTTCIGFAITIVSIQLLNYLQTQLLSQYLLVLLLPGPLFGILYLLKRPEV